MKGGKVVASGAMGCVFDPALLCEGQTDRQEGLNKTNTRRNHKKRKSKSRRKSKKN